MILGHGDGEIARLGKDKESQGTKSLAGCDGCGHEYFYYCKKLPFRRKI